MSLILLIAALPASGCGIGGPKDTPVDPLNSPTTSSAPAGDRPGRWSKLAGPCPTLTGAAAKSLKLPEAGTPGEVSNNNVVFQASSCDWGKGQGSVAVTLTVMRSSGSSTAEEDAAKNFQESWDKLRNGGWIVHSTSESNLADKAYLGIARGNTNVVLTVLSSNANFTIYYRVPEMAPEAWDQSLTKYRDTMRGLAADVIDDLR